MATPLPDELHRVLQLAASGLTSGEIAEELGLPPDTVHRRLGEAIAFLGARSKLEAVLIAFRLGLIDLAPPPSHADPHDSPHRGT